MMNHKWRLFAAAITLALITASSLTAQDACPETQRWATCLEDLLNRNAKFEGVLEDLEDEAKKPETAKNNKDDLGDLLRNVLTGAATGSEFNLEDFLSSFLTAVDIDGLEDTDGGFMFKKNFQVSSGTLAVEAEAKKGELFPELKMKLEGEEQTELIETLNGELEDFDDLNLNVTYSVDRSGKGKWWGRRFRSGGVKTGNGDMATKLFDLVVADLGQRKTDMRDALSTLNQELGQEARTLTVGNTPAESKAKAFKALEKFAEAEKADFETFEGALNSANYFAFGKLVANQPQFVLSAGRTFRDELVGRDSLNVSVKYEMGQANVNGLRARDCWKNPKSKSAQLQCYKDFIKDKDSDLKTNWRVSLSGSYSWKDKYDYSSPDGAVTLTAEESESYEATLSAGRTLRLGNDPDDPNNPDKKVELTRFDIEAVTKGASGDTEEQSRFVSTATLTQRVTDQFSLAIGVVFADRPEFRGDVEHEFSAKAGLKLKLQRPD